MARNRTANISGELITNTIIVTSTGANVSNALVKTGDTMTGELNVANNLVVTGNVGIGTASPGFTLETVGTVGLSTNGVSVLATFGASNNTDKYLRIRNSDGNFEIGSNSNGHYLYGNGNLPVRIFANGVNRLHVTSDGNLGLGVTPSAWSGIKALQINEQAAITARSGGDGLYLLNNAYFSGDPGFGTINNSVYTFTSPATAYLQNYGSHRWYNAPSGTAGNTATFTQVMTLEATGGLAIGRTSTGGNATDKVLAVEGTGSAQIALFYNNTNGAYLYSNQFNTVLSSVQNLPLLFSTNNTERLRIDSSGNFIFNENGNDSDFRVESDTETHALFVDAGLGLISIASNGCTSATIMKKVQVGASSSSSITFDIGSDFGVTNRYYFHFEIDVGVYGNASDGPGVYKIVGGGYSDTAGDMATAVLANSITNGSFSFSRTNTDQYIITITNTGSQTKFCVGKMIITYG